MITSNNINDNNIHFKKKSLMITSNKIHLKKNH